MVHMSRARNPTNHPHCDKVGVTLKVSHRKALVLKVYRLVENEDGDG